MALYKEPLFFIDFFIKICYNIYTRLRKDMKNMVQTVSMSADTPSRLTLKLNDWLKGWAEDRILNIQFIYRERLMEPYLVFVTYKK